MKKENGILYTCPYCKSLFVFTQKAIENSYKADGKTITTDDFVVCPNDECKSMIFIKVKPK